MGKVLDPVIHAKNSNALRTSNLQFGYKTRHSTVSCSFVLQEVIHHYVSRGTPVLCISLDASKAFDRVEFSSLFDALIRRDFCATALRFLYRMYTQQEIMVRWQETLSERHGISNGVKQGGVLSPWLFTVYMDELLQRLSMVDGGCRIGCMYAGALCYADDIVLLAPTSTALDRMLRVVENFATTYKMTFNPLKSSFVTHSVDAQKYNFRLMGREIPHCLRVKHLGLISGENACVANVKEAIGDLYGRTNCVVAQFRHVPHNIRIHLFESFCLHMYGCELWNPCSASAEHFAVAFRKCLRHLLGLPQNTHRALLPPVSGIRSSDLLMLNRCSNFVRMCNSSNNQLVNLCMQIALHGSRSNMSISIAKLCELHSYDRVSIFIKPLSVSTDNNNRIIADVITELLNVLDGSLIIQNDVFDNDTYIREFMNFLCTF